MSYQKFVLIALATLAAAALVTSRPQEYRLLADVANKTMCPIKVVIDEDPNRIPRRIKFLKCDENPNRMCVEHQMQHGCCRHHHHNFVTECVEITDWVQVSYKGSDKTETMRVPVGCTCMIEESSTAHEID